MRKFGDPGAFAITPTKVDELYRNNPEAQQKHVADLASIEKEKSGGFFQNLFAGKKKNTDLYASMAGGGAASKKDYLMGYANGGVGSDLPEHLQQTTYNEFDKMAFPEVEKSKELRDIAFSKMFDISDKKQNIMEEIEQTKNPLKKLLLTQKHKKLSKESLKNQRSADLYGYEADIRGNVGNILYNEGNVSKYMGAGGDYGGIYDKKVDLEDIVRQSIARGKMKEEYTKKAKGGVAKKKKKKKKRGY